MQGQQACSHGTVRTLDYQEGCFSHLIVSLCTKFVVTKLDLYDFFFYYKLVKHLVSKVL